MELKVFYSPSKREGLRWQIDPTIIIRYSCLDMFMIKKLTHTLDLFRGVGRLSTFRLVSKDKNLSMGAFVAQNAQRTPNKVMIVTEDKEVTWGEFNQRANQYAHYFKSLGVVAGDTVSLLMENEPEMLAALVGVCKLGAVAALININLRGRALKHCIDTVSSKLIVFGPACVDAVSEVCTSAIHEDARYWTTNNLINIDTIATSALHSTLDWAASVMAELNAQPQNNPQETNRIAFTSPAYYIFTSGTTGLPKAAVVTHYHWYRASYSFDRLLLGLKPDDRIYVCLPLFHTAAMLIGFGASTTAGSSFYLAKRFSASRFWSEVCNSNSNIFLYIGELCRYLLNAPVQESDGINPLTTCIGNGLGPDLWQEFKQRFLINKVAEYYGSTEGNLAFMNILNRDYTFGMGLGRFKVVQYDEDAGELVKDSRGYCIPVKTGETGLLINKITEKSPFNGYTDKTATESKILQNVIQDGDSYFNTGDLIRRADVGFTFGIGHYQFVDRVGDTFRWKGENVSATEVSEVINNIQGVVLSSVYGVQIPNADGRAGMVALVVDKEKFCRINFSKVIANALPKYAQPIFVRIMTSLETTDTYKIKKMNLKNEAYNIGMINDDVWVKKPSADEYALLNSGFYQEIENGKSGY
jgi:citronellyl-CoA synthetase